MNKDTPLYRLYHNGASHLSTSELLSIVIGPGMGEQKAIKLSNDILNCFELNEIGAATIDELNNIQGITKMKASVISAMILINGVRMPLFRKSTWEKPAISPIATKTMGAVIIDCDDLFDNSPNPKINMAVKIRIG